MLPLDMDLPCDYLNLSDNLQHFVTSITNYTLYIKKN